MKKLQLYSIRVEKAINNEMLFYIAGETINEVVGKMTSSSPDALINKVTYEGDIYA